jgi:hypothetical protein
LLALQGSRSSACHGRRTLVVPSGSVKRTLESMLDSQFVSYFRARSFCRD